MSSQESSPQRSEWSWWALLKRTVRRGFRADNVKDWAAALTYYGVLSIFPAIIALVSVVGLLGSSATSSLLQNLKSFSPGPAKDILTNAVTGLANSRGQAPSCSPWGARPLVGQRLRRRVHACGERHLGRARRPADLEDRTCPAGDHARYARHPRLRGVVVTGPVATAWATCLASVAPR